MTVTGSDDVEDEEKKIHFAFSPSYLPRMQTSGRNPYGGRFKSPGQSTDQHQPK